MGKNLKQSENFKYEKGKKENFEKKNFKNKKGSDSLKNHK